MMSAARSLCNSVSFLLRTCSNHTCQHIDIAIAVFCYFGAGHDTCFFRKYDECCLFALLPFSLDLTFVEKIAHLKSIIPVLKIKMSCIRKLHRFNNKD